MSDSVIHRFVASALRHDTRPALWARGHIYTYGELSRIAEGIRQQILQHGLRHAPRIGVITGDDVHTYAAILAILANGSAYVPLNINNPVSRSLSVVDSANLDAVLYSAPSDLSAAIYEHASGHSKILDVANSTEHADHPLDIDWPEICPLAYLFFTSGSTGTPKGVPISHENLIHFISVMTDQSGYDFVPTDRFLQMFELTFDLSVMSLFVPLSIGASCFVVPDDKIGYVATVKVLSEQKITVALMVPSLLVHMEPHLERLQLPHLRLSMFCGEALPESLAQKWHRSAPNSMLENDYGPTEATIFCLRYRWSPEHSSAAAVNGIVPIGKPMPGTEALIVDEDGKAIEKSGVKGELLLLGSQLTAGYWKDKSKTEAAFLRFQLGPENFKTAYRTGDLCSADDNGDFIYHGRLDSQVKVDGHRVELGEIEHHIRESLGRSNIAVIAASFGMKTVLVIYLEQPQIDFKELRERLRQRLPKHMIPRHICYIDRLPLNLNGKVDRPHLRQLFETQP